MQKRVLITGGAGFLGSHLCERFLSEGYQVIAMEILGWQPQVGRREGLEKTYAYFRNLLPIEWTKEPKNFQSVK